MAEVANKRIFFPSSVMYCGFQILLKNIDHLSQMVDYRPMVNNIDPVAALQLAPPNDHTQWDQYRILHSGPLGPGCCNGENPDF